MEEERCTMKRIAALLVGALVAAGLAAGPALPASAGTVDIPGFPGAATVTITFPDMQWDNAYSCLEGPVMVQVAGTAVHEWVFWAEIRYQADLRFSWELAYAGEGTGDFLASRAVKMCPAEDGNGIYAVNGAAAISSDPSGIGLWSDPIPFTTTFTLSAMPTATTLANPTVVGALTTFSGKVVATSTTGAIAPDKTGQVAIETLTGSTWTRIGLANPDAAGFFAIPVATVLVPGTQYRASYLGTTTCKESSSAVQVVPTPAVVLPSPSVKVKAVSGRSKLKVDVNPNMGRKYWTFQVQRKNTDGTWKALKTYRTIGSAEKRTVNLPKGTYRVFVNPKFGYQGATSVEITLKR
jgi:hypothetical protein